MKRSVFLFLVFVLAVPAIADVTLTDRQSALRIVADSGLTPEQKQALRDANKAKRDAKKAKQGGRAMRIASDAALTPGEKQALRDANKAKRDAKRARRGKFSKYGSDSLTARPDATGSVQLIDAGGLKYFINTNITFSTSSSASGAASEASYSAPIAASTSAGGTVMSSLSDMFDGYQGLCVSLTNATGPCQTGNANYVMYEKNGPATVDATVPATPTCTNRQYVWPAQTIGGLSVYRKVFVPTNDRFIRWTNFYTNTTGAPITFTTITSNNLGSDSNTKIVTSSSGDAIATTSDSWVTTFQNYSGNSSSDPRIGHVFQGSSSPGTPVSIINFADGDDNPYWGYSITLAPGQTKAITNFATGLGSKAAAATQAAALATFGATTQQCYSATELGQIANFAAGADLSITKTASTSSTSPTFPFSYTINVNNAGPNTATSVQVTDVLPASVNYVSASGTGWTCGFATGTVTCTLPSLAVGAANPITINLTARNTPATSSNSPTVSPAPPAPTPANHSSAAAVVAIVAVIPTLDPSMLAALAAVLAMVAVFAMKRNG